MQNLPRLQKGALKLSSYLTNIFPNISFKMHLVGNARNYVHRLFYAFVDHLTHAHQIESKVAHAPVHRYWSAMDNWKYFNCFAFCYLKSVWNCHVIDNVMKPTTHSIMKIWKSIKAEGILQKCSNEIQFSDFKLS